ncbi:MAG TPA: response regulator [Solirubrobacterales bacterium]|nr:response regulator [Solirubrobacterales bacterium]
MAKILVADDSETILLLVQTRLKMEGHEVETAADGQEVIDTVLRAADNPHDIFLLDAMMPRKSGIDALRELRAMGVETPVLIVSAHTDGGDGNGDRADLEIDGYVNKPIDFDRLFAKITELTER